jgi:hypothetical protein
MINRNVPYPELSPNFTLEDIRKIRDYDYEVLKDATTDEITRYYSEKAQPFLDGIEKRRRERQGAIRNEQCTMNNV